ncbi:hypothetical protein E2C01_096323 [Portunus trituberculatus]|uniref:Uncharacterized protein n=1 Tax=Portunus trituberculatus TaxID=210409 RepID=A0A5B7JXN1_PORTR|nr:hypothetical protein [Portunus trituberculatus]
MLFRTLSSYTSYQTPYHHHQGNPTTPHPDQHHSPAKPHPSITLHCLCNLCLIPHHAPFSLCSASLATPSQPPHFAFAADRLL